MKILTQILILFLMTFLVAVVVCTNKFSSVPNLENLNLEDGIYLVKRVAKSNKEKLSLSSNELKIEFNQYFKKKTAQDLEYIIINKKEFVPLKLREQPKTENQADNRKRLMLNLTDKAKEALKDFTTKHLHQLISIVVNGEALTMHKIKSVIDGGHLQISRCTDNACELLYLELQDNVVKE